MRSRTNPRTWSMAWQLFALQVVIVAVIVVAGGAAAYLQARDRSESATRDRVLSVARAVAASRQVRDDLAAPEPALDLQPYAERVRRDTGTDFVVVMGTDRTRYSHPHPALIGQPFLGHIGPALAGGVVLETYAGTLGPSERAVVPVRADGGPVLGLVAVGVTRESVARDLARDVPRVFGAAVVALLLAAGGAVLVSRRLDRQTHGLGPDELGRMYEFYDSVLHSVREGLVLLDPGGRLVLANDEACRLLDLPPDWEGRRLDEIGLPAPMSADLVGGRLVDDAIYLTSTRVLVVNQAPARGQDRDLGTVLTLRDHTDLQALTGELTSARGLAEALRSQAHEAANRLHSVISLIELGHTDQALTFATAELRAAQLLTDVVVGAVDEPILAALLLGKAAEASERGVELEVDVATSVPEGALPARDLVTVVGNLLDNAIDAAAGRAGPRRVRFGGWIDDAPTEQGIASTLVLQVSDTGAGLDDESAAHVFTRGWSTKVVEGAASEGGADEGGASEGGADEGAVGRAKQDGGLVGRGLGLALVGQVAERHRGHVEVTRDGGPGYGGAVFTVRLPLLAEVAR